MLFFVGTKRKIQIIEKNVNFIETIRGKQQVRYKVKTKDCRLIVTAKASWGEQIDQTAVDAFARVYLRGFLKPKVVKNNVLEYSGPVGISLYERLKKPMTKRDFLFIMEQIVVAVQKIQSNNLSLNRVVLDLHYVFINDVTKELQFLYVPSSNPIVNPGVVAFMESIVYTVLPAPENDTEYVSRFIHFLKAQSVFKPEQIERYIAKEDRSVVNIIKRQNAGQSGFMTSKQKHYYEHYQSDNIEDATALLDQEDEERTGLLDENTDESTGILYEDEFEETGYMDDTADETGYLEDTFEETGYMDDTADETGYLEDTLEETGYMGQMADDTGYGGYESDETGYLGNESDETGYLGDESDDLGTAPLNGWQEVRYPTLHRTLTDETISINKPVFRLGKERSYVDYFVTNNNAVSRSHADIITRGNKYFVIDLNSKNHTYINDQMLAVQCESEIRNGDHLKLGNEEFVFHV